MNQKTGQDFKRGKRRPFKPNNFLEALRDLGSDVVDTAVDDVVGGFAETAFNQIVGQKKSGELKPNQAVDLKKPTQNSSEFYQEKKEQFQQFQQEFLDIRHQERLIFKRTEQETKLQIAAVIEELKKLSLSTKNLAKEVEIAATQVPVEPGIYHVNFFERLRQTLIFLKQKIDESATWLAAFNSRSKKRNYYWNQFKKSGTKFLLSQERYMSTQAG